MQRNQHARADQLPPCLTFSLDQHFDLLDRNIEKWRKSVRVSDHKLFLLFLKRWITKRSGLKKNECVSFSAVIVTISKITVK